MYLVYILYNPTIDKYYIGHTKDLSSRVGEHNKSFHNSKYTRKQPGKWIFVYKEEYKLKSESMKREKEIKSWKSKQRIKLLVEQSR